MSDVWTPDPLLSGPKLAKPRRTPRPEPAKLRAPAFINDVATPWGDGTMLLKLLTDQQKDVDPTS